uniref:non-specific serine/threonine protein kinase n=1 Tax=Aplanochytrium stocchinoi TaxID=215587 RepID=A0A7S3LIZ2_9STRA
MLYEMASLRPPFEAKNVVALGRKIVTGKFEPISTRYSTELQDAISLMLSTNPQDRPSVSELVKLPRLSRYIKEGRVLVREYQSQWRLSHRFKELRAREEELKRIEKDLIRREKEVKAREESASAMEKRITVSSKSPCQLCMGKFPYGSPFSSPLTSTSSPTTTHLQSIDELLNREIYYKKNRNGRRLSEESACSSSTTCSNASGLSSTSYRYINNNIHESKRRSIGNTACKENLRNLANIQVNPDMQNVDEQYLRRVYRTRPRPL